MVHFRKIALVFIPRHRRSPTTFHSKSNAQKNGKHALQLTIKHSLERATRLNAKTPFLWRRYNWREHWKRQTDKKRGRSWITNTEFMSIHSRTPETLGWSEITLGSYVGWRGFECFCRGTEVADHPVTPSISIHLQSETVHPVLQFFYVFKLNDERADKIHIKHVNWAWRLEEFE